MSLLGIDSTPLRYPNLSHPTWTPEDVGNLKKLWESGRSCSAIGVELGYSKNAIIGKVHRLGLPQRPRKIYENGIKRKRNAAPVAPSIDDEIPLEQRKQLIDLGPHDCRWPVGDVGAPDFFFCGGDTLDDLPYCAAHCRRAFGRRA